jgi:hypothetical protein
MAMRLAAGMVSSNRSLPTKMDCEQKESGEVVCTHTSDDDCYGEKLGKAHAEFVTLLLKDIDTKDEDNEYLIDDQKCQKQAILIAQIYRERNTMIC